jgi:hypothetical protein
MISMVRLFLPVLSLLGILAAGGPAAAAQGGQKLILNCTEWKDTAGQPISAHEHFVGRFDGVFYWYGTSYKGNPMGRCGPDGAALRNGFNVYRSKNLVDWEYAGECLKFPKAAAKFPDGSADASEGTGHRPCVFYNKTTKKYVMWYFYFRKYPDVMLSVATADDPAGPFEIQPGLRKSAEEHGWAQDLGGFQDTDGKAYIVYDDGHRNLRVELLSDDYLNTTGQSVIALEVGPGPGQQYEGSAIAKYRGKYIVAGSGVQGWNPTDTTYAVADKPLGKYSAPRRLGNPGTWGSQISNFLYIAETDGLIALCDQWWAGPAGRNDLEQSRYVWVPVVIDPKTRQAKGNFRWKWDPFLRKSWSWTGDETGTPQPN